MKTKPARLSAVRLAPPQWETVSWRAPAGQVPRPGRGRSLGPLRTAGAKGAPAARGPLRQLLRRRLRASGKFFALNRSRLFALKRKFQPSEMTERARNKVDACRALFKRPAREGTEGRSVRRRPRATWAWQKPRVQAGGTGTRPRAPWQLPVRA